MKFPVGAFRMATELDFVSAPSTEIVETARRPLEASQCALIVIDIQEKMLPPFFRKEQLVRNPQLLIRLGGVQKVATTATTPSVKGFGHQVGNIQPFLPRPVCVKP